MEFKTKFNLKDNAWIIQNNKIKQIVISSIEIHKLDNDKEPTIIYTAKNYINPKTWLDNTNLHEKSIFTTKEELLKSL